MKVNQLFVEKYKLNFANPDVVSWVKYNLNHRRRPTYKTWIDENTIVKRIRLGGPFNDMVFTNRENFAVRFVTTDINNYFIKI